MKKIRIWCPGGRTPVEPNRLRGGRVRCPVCDQRFLPKETRGEEPRLEVPPHKAY